MTDGRANIGRDGEGGRTQAMEDALDAGQRLFAAGVAALAIDTSPPSPRSAKPRRRSTIAEAMGARLSQAAASPTRRGSTRRSACPRSDCKGSVMLWRAEPLSFDRDGARLAEPRGERLRRRRAASAGMCSSMGERARAPAAPRHRRLDPLLGGAGAAARQALSTCVAPDLPGHGFTRPKAAPDLSLPGMARAVGGAARSARLRPKVVVGHSAGAAILARLCLDETIAPKLFVSLNGAFLPFEGAAGLSFPTIAKLLFLNPLAPRVFAWAADREAVASLLLRNGIADRRRRASTSTPACSAIRRMSPARSA